MPEMNKDTELLERQASMQKAAAKLLRDIRRIRRDPLAADVPAILSEVLLAANGLKTEAIRFHASLVEHADAQHAEKVAERRKWKSNMTPGQQARLDLLKRGGIPL